MVLISRICTICTLGSSITAQIVVLYCWDWHAEISATIHNCPHWIRGVFRTWGYRDNITNFAIREALLLSCVQWKSRRDLVVTDFGERKGARSSLRGSMWAWGKTRGSLLGVEHDVGARPETLLSMENVDNWYLEFVVHLWYSWCGATHVAILGSDHILTTTLFICVIKPVDQACWLLAHCMSTGWLCKSKCNLTRLLNKP